MGDEATHHGVPSFVSFGIAARLRRVAEVAGSKTIQLPDHHPGFVEQAVDVTENPVDDGLHGVSPVVVVADRTTIAPQCCSWFSGR
jgi:hypothetical protein